MAREQLKSPSDTLVRTRRRRWSAWWLVCEVGWDVPADVQDSPDVDEVVACHAEDEVREPFETPAPKIWDLELEGESKRASERMSA